MYRAKTDDEIWRLRMESEQLTPEAREQLEREMHNRGINSKNWKEDSLEDENSVAPKALRSSDRISLWFPSLRRFAATLNEWRRYRMRTGEWPTLSIMAYTIHAAFLLGWTGCLIWFGLSHNWSRTKFVVVFLPLLLIDILLEERIKRKIRLKELRIHRRKRAASAARPSG